jgi:hypothetical protein
MQNDATLQNENLNLKGPIKLALLCQKFVRNELFRR